MYFIFCQDFNQNKNYQFSEKNSEQVHMQRIKTLFRFPKHETKDGS